MPESKIIEDPAKNKEDMVEDEGLKLMPSQEEVEEMLNFEKVKKPPEEAFQKQVSEAKEEFDNTSEKDKERHEREPIKEMSEAERKARAKGWLPKDEFKGADGHWITADKFNNRMDMMEKIDNQRSELSALKKTNEKMLDMFQKMAEKDVKEKSDVLLEKKKEAILDGNIEDVERYEKEYHEATKEFNSFKDLVPNAPQETPKELIAFAERNKGWYNADTSKNEEMQMYANNLDSKYLDDPYYNSMPIYKRLEEVEKAVKRAYPERFHNPNRDRAPAVESKSYADSGSLRDYGYKDLPVELKKVAKEFVQGGAGLSLDDYAKQLFETGAVSYE